MNLRQVVLQLLWGKTQRCAAKSSAVPSCYRNFWKVTWNKTHPPRALTRMLMKTSLFNLRFESRQKTRAPGEIWWQRGKCVLRPPGCVNERAVLVKSLPLAKTNLKCQLTPEYLFRGPTLFRLGECHGDQFWNLCFSLLVPLIEKETPKRTSTVVDVFFRNRTYLFR